MVGVFTVLALLSIACMIWGLAAPAHLSKTAKLNKPAARVPIGLTFGFLTLLFLVLAGVTAPKQPASKLTSAPLATKTSNQQPTITTKTITTTSSIAFTTKNEDDNSLDKGETKTVQTGQNGVETSTFLATYTNGHQTSKKLESQTVTTQPVQQIVENGTYIAPAPAPTPSPTPSSSCYPLSDENTCYEPGEYCRDSDQGVTGVAGDGESIICEENDGLRWEPN